MTVQHSPTGRLAPIFDACRAEGRAALIGYLPTGYPDVPTSIEAMVAMCESGCDIIEVGVPYSDPGMDGPVIATATETALQSGVRVSDTLRAVEAISAAGGKAVVMSYWNPVLHYGVDAFARGLAAAATALRPGGVLAVWSSTPSSEFSRALSRAGYKVDEIKVHAHGKRARHCRTWAGGSVPPQCRRGPRHTGVRPRLGAGTSGARHPRRPGQLGTCQRVDCHCSHSQPNGKCRCRRSTRGSTADARAADRY